MLYCTNFVLLYFEVQKVRKEGNDLKKFAIFVFIVKGKISQKRYKEECLMKQIM